MAGNAPDGAAAAGTAASRSHPAALWFAGLPTGTKMFLIMGLALLPLGIVAIFATVNAAQTSRASDVAEAQSILSLSAQRLTSAITRAGVAIRLASDAVREGSAPAASRACQQAAQQMASESALGVRLALYGADNRIACATQGFTPPRPPPQAGATYGAVLDPEAGALRVILYDALGLPLGQAEFPAATLATITRPAVTRAILEISLDDDGHALILHEAAAHDPLRRQVVRNEPVLGDRRLELRLRAGVERLSLHELFMILLPLLMWLFAAVVGWLVIDRLLLRPLIAMQKAIAAYKPGDRGFEAPEARSPAREIGDLGQAFDQVTRTVARHEAELEAAVERQKRLVREVHHRVKNNLQVVASLLNLHSRGAHNEEVSAAYATIQRRVDALAVVHRYHHAELEENHGVPLKPLVTELSAGLRASAPAGAGLQIRLALEPFYTVQDVAVPIAFLITEAVEYGMLCGTGPVSITLEPAEPGKARLTIESDALVGEPRCPADVHQRFSRIVDGLSRQLRSTLVRDEELGGISLNIAVIHRGAS